MLSMGADDILKLWKLYPEEDLREGVSHCLKEFFSEGHKPTACTWINKFDIAVGFSTTSKLAVYDANSGKLKQMING